MPNKLFTDLRKEFNKLVGEYLNLNKLNSNEALNEIYFKPNEK